MDKERLDSINKYLIGVKTGDKISLELLYYEIAPTIRFIALKYLKNQHDADDIVQDFWLHIYQTAKGFKYLQNGFNFLCKAMTRRTINRYNKLHREQQKKFEYVNYETIDFGIDTDPEKSEIKDMVENALNILTENEKIIIQLTYFEDKTVREIARILAISKSQVFKLKSAALNKMKISIEKYVDKEDV